MSITLIVMGFMAAACGFVMVWRKFKTPSGMVIFATGIVLVIAGSCLFSSEKADRCRKDGGTWTAIGNDSVCLSPDGRIINRG